MAGLTDLAEIYFRTNVLKSILIRNVYFHKLSPEGDTGRVKSKYKVLVNRIPELETYIFFALTSHISTCPSHVRCEINQGDYHEKVGRYPDGISYINAEKVITESVDSLISYHRPPDEFNFLGKILQTKLNEIRSKCKEITTTRSIGSDVRDMLLAASGEAAEYIRKFNI